MALYLLHQPSAGLDFTIRSRRDRSVQELNERYNPRNKKKKRKKRKIYLNTLQSTETVCGPCCSFHARLFAVVLVAKLQPMAHLPSSSCSQLHAMSEASAGWQVTTSSKTGLLIMQLDAMACPCTTLSPVLPKPSGSHTRFTHTTAHFFSFSRLSAPVDFACPLAPAVSCLVELW